MSEQQDDHGDKKKAGNAVKKGMFQGRRCFICNEQLKGNTCQLAKTNTKFTSTPFSRCLNEVMGPQYEVTVGKNDKDFISMLRKKALTQLITLKLKSPNSVDNSCQRCAALIQQRDKFAQDLEGVNKALRGFLTRKYTLMTITSKHNTLSDIDPNCIRQVTSGASLMTGQHLGQRMLPNTSMQMDSLHASQRNTVAGKAAGRGKKKQSAKTVQLYQCVKCHSSTTDPSDLKNHVCIKEAEKSTHNEEVNKVPVGSKIGHIKILHPIKPGENKVPEKFICRFCDVEFTKKGDFVAHNREHLSASSNLIECKVCSEIFTAQDELEVHKKIHQPVKCTSCLETFKNVDNLAAHLTPTLKINANHCSPCNTSFATKDDITNHIANLHPNMKEDTENPIHVMKLTYVCTCCQNELEEFKEFSRHKDEHIAESVAQSKDLLPIKEKMQSECEAQATAEETEHDYAMEVNEPSTSNTSVEKENKENTSSGPKKPVYECGMCSMRAESIEKLMEHFKSHKSTKILCKHCHIQLPSVNALSKHLQYHTLPGQGVECQICTPSTTLKSKEMLMRHMADLHKMKHHCPHCGEQFRFLKELVNHQNMHPESRKFGCPKCGMRFLLVNQLQRHLELTHRDPRCKVCSKVIRNPIKLRQHEARHRNDKYSCTKCERIFKTPSGLKNHMAVHTGEYKYRCDTCERGFMNRNIFIEHTNNHLDQPKPLYKCNICGKNFFYQGSLWIHRKWHNNPYPYECKLCGKKLRHASVLQVHLRKHRGERPYKCPYCPMTFNSPSTFKRHLMLHTGEYSFKCTDCNKGFTGKNKYLMHRHSIHGDPIPKKPIMTAMDFKVNVPVQHANSTTNLSGHPTAYIVENMGSCESGNEEDIVPRVVEVVINEEQQAVSSITLLSENIRWSETTSNN